MVKCKFCQRTFRSPQAVRAHLKHCSHYQTVKSKRSAASGSLPQACSTSTETPPIQSSQPHVAPDFTAPLEDLMASISEFSTKQNVPETVQQQHRRILQAAKAQVIDHYRTPLGHVTGSLRGDAKLAIEQKLAPLALAELPFEEVCELASAARDACYVPAFTRQTREAERQRVEGERRHTKEVEILGALLRADRRKKRFMRQANQQAYARCESKAIRGWDQVALLSDVGTSLEEFLTGSESILDAYAIIEKVLDARFVEAEATLEAVRVKAAEQWREEVEATLVLGAVVGLVVLSLKYPAQTLAIFNWIERIFAYTPGAEAAAPTPKAAETTPPSASPKVRSHSTRRRKYPDTPSSPESPWGNSVGGEPAHA